MSRLYWVYIGIKKIWHHLPPTANNGHLNHNQPWPTLTEMVPLHPTWGLAPRTIVIARWGKTLRARAYKFLKVEGVYCHQNTLMLRQCIIVGTKERFEGHKPPHSPQNYTRLLRGLSPIHLTRCWGAWGLIWGVRGSFLPASALVVDVGCVCFVVFRSMNHFFPVEPHKLDIAGKLLSQARQFLHCTDAMP